MRVRPDKKIAVWGHMLQATTFFRQYLHTMPFCAHFFLPSLYFYFFSPRQTRSVLSTTRGWPPPPPSFHHPSSSPSNLRSRAPPAMKRPWPNERTNEANEFNVSSKPRSVPLFLAKVVCRFIHSVRLRLRCLIKSIRNQNHFYCRDSRRCLEDGSG